MTVDSLINITQTKFKYLIGVFLIVLSLYLFIKIIPKLISDLNSPVNWVMLIIILIYFIVGVYTVRKASLRWTKEEEIDFKLKETTLKKINVEIEVMEDKLKGK